MRVNFLGNGWVSLLVDGLLLAMVLARTLSSEERVPRVPRQEMEA